jgi:hypothetical protein
MSSTQQASSSIALLDPSTRNYHDLLDPTTATYTIRNPQNSLQEDSDAVDNLVYRVTPGLQITDEQVQSCASAFSAHYGVWSPEASAELVPWAKAGKLSVICKDRRSSNIFQIGTSIRLSASKLREVIIPKDTNNVLITAVNGDGDQIGHCFVCQWMKDGDCVWWITQLVVLPEYRNQRRATRVNYSSWKDMLK